MSRASAPRQIFPSDLIAMSDADLDRHIATAAGIRASREQGGGFETATVLRNIADALLRPARGRAA